VSRERAGVLTPGGQSLEQAQWQNNRREAARARGKLLVHGGPCRESAVSAQ
jgi:hypothetical protein